MKDNLQDGNKPSCALVITASYTLYTYFILLLKEMKDNLQDGNNPSDCIGFDSLP